MDKTLHNQMAENGNRWSQSFLQDGPKTKHNMALARHKYEYFHNNALNAADCSKIADKWSQDARSLFVQNGNKIPRLPVLNFFFLMLKNINK